MSRKARVSLVKFVTFCFLSFYLSLSQAEVTLTVGKGSADPPATDSPVAVSLENQDDRVRGIQVDVCDVDDYLTCTGCEITDRTADFTCAASEITNPDNPFYGCCRVVLFSLSAERIEAGQGDIFTINYDVSNEAPSGCRELTTENASISDENNHPMDVTSISGGFCFPCTDNADCDDGLFCNGDDSCIDGACVHSGNPCPSGTECNEETNSCDPINTTTTTTTPTTTTTMITLSYNVTISPSSATLDSDASLQFSAKTTSNGQEVVGEYIWEIEPASTIGSTIGENGLFAAGANTTESVVEETVKVTDTTHENEFATATVTINVKETPPPECEVKINPSSATVFSGDILTLTASTIGEECNPGDYEWSITATEIGSIIDQEGNYTAGSNDTESQVTDTITVVDHANGDISESAVIAVESEELVKNVTVFPPVLLGSRWIPLPYILLIIGEDTKFDLNSTIYFEPEGDVLKLFQFGFGNIMFAMVFLSASPQEGTVNIIINTGGEVVTGEITIRLLPFPLAEDYLGSAASL